MNHEASKAAHLERLLAGVLQYGSWLASVTIGLGLALTLIASRMGSTNPGIRPSMNIATLGIALFILLPSLRVFLMLIVFLRARDYRFGIIAALVLTIILLGFALGMRTVPSQNI